MLSETGTKIPSIYPCNFLLYKLNTNSNLFFFGWPDIWNFGPLNSWGIFITWFCILKYANYTCNERNVHELCVSVSHPPGTACTSAWGNLCFDSQCLSGSHTPSLFWCWFWRIPALAWVTDSVKQVFFKLLSGNVNRISPHLSFLVTCCCSLKHILNAIGILRWLICIDILFTTNLLCFLLSNLSSWMIHTTKKTQINIHLQGSWAYRAPAPHIWGIG